MQQEDKIRELQVFAQQIRVETIRALATLGFGHTGGTMSVTEALAVLYGGIMKIDPQNPGWEERDWCVMSKGHAGPAVYATLALKGFFPKEELLTLNKPGTNLPSHCDMNRTPGIDMTTGSLGQGTSSAVGIACGNRKKGLDNYTYLIIGDGESQEGQVWEAALFAAQHKLSHLIAFTDYNKCQIDGTISEVCELGDLAGKYEAFGWYAQSVDGHDVEQISEAIHKAKQQGERPSMIVLNTVKGKGVSLAEGKVGSHNMPVTREQMDQAMAELDSQLAAL